MAKRISLVKELIKINHPIQNLEENYRFSLTQKVKAVWSVSSFSMRFIESMKLILSFAFLEYKEWFSNFAFKKILTGLIYKYVQSI